VDEFPLHLIKDAEFQSPFRALEENVFLPDDNFGRGTSKSARRIGRRRKVVDPRFEFDVGWHEFSQ
jgi:hypothetical protein